MGGSQKTTLADPNHILVKLQDGESVYSAIERYKNLPGVEIAQPNYVYRMNSIPPNDPSYSQQWAAKNTGQTIVKLIDSLYSINNPPSGQGYDLGLEDAWNLNSDCNSTVIAVIDSGINYDHEELGNTFWESPSCVGNYWVGTKYCKYGFDFVDIDDSPMDYTGHGTHVAGIIAAQGDNGKGIAGVCRTARIMSVRVLDQYGNGTSATVSLGVTFAINNGAKIINMSLDGPTNDPSVSTAITNAGINDDVLFIVSAGSQGADLSSTNRYPCEYSSPNIICVGSADQKGSLATFSNYDTSASLSNRSIDILAPGANILSSYNKILTGYITIDPSTGWTYSGNSSNDWGYIPDTATCYSEMFYSNGPGFGFPGGCGSYALPNTNSYVYSTFDLSEYNEALLKTRVKFEVADAGDYLEFLADPNGGDPIQNGVSIKRPFQQPANTFENYIGDLTFCTTSTCSVGIKMVTDSDGTVPARTIVKSLSINWAKSNNSYYNVMSGTSMSAAFVTGTAALLKNYQPSFNYSDIFYAIVNSGDSTSAAAISTKFGTSLNTYKALIYLKPPTITSGVLQ
nr:S8 family serine peptidase [Leptospira sarikeiensis]